MNMEYFGSGALAVERGRIEPALAEAAYTELSVIKPFFGDAINYGQGVDQVAVKACKISFAANTAAILAELRMNSKKKPININYQRPNADQEFHIDNPLITMKAGMLAVVHLTDGGAFDFSINAGTMEEARNDFERIEPLNAGDVVYQFDKFFVHRGVNSSDSPRITLGIPLPYSFEQNLVLSK